MARTLQEDPGALGLVEIGEDPAALGLAPVEAGPGELGLEEVPADPQALGLEEIRPARARIKEFFHGAADALSRALDQSERFKASPESRPTSPSTPPAGDPGSTRPTEPATPETPPDGRYNPYKDILVDTPREAVTGTARGVEHYLGAHGSIIQALGDQLTAIRRNSRALLYSPDSPVGKLLIAGRDLLGMDPEQRESAIVQRDLEVNEKVARFGRETAKWWENAAATGLEARQPEIYEGSFLENPSVARVIGGAAESGPTMAMALALSAAGAPNLGAGLLAATEVAPEYTRMRELGMAEHEAMFNALIMGIGTYVLEKVGLQTLTGKNAAANKLVERMGKTWYAGAVVNFATEGSQEAAQEIYQNAVRMGYDGDATLFMGALEAGISGGLLGAVGGAGYRASARKMQAEYLDAIGIDMAAQRQYREAKHRADVEVTRQAMIDGGLPAPAADNIIREPDPLRRRAMFANWQRYLAGQQATPGGEVGRTTNPDGTLTIDIDTAASLPTPGTEAAPPVQPVEKERSPASRAPFASTTPEASAFQSTPESGRRADETGTKQESQQQNDDVATKKARETAQPPFLDLSTFTHREWSDRRKAHAEGLSEPVLAAYDVDGNHLFFDIDGNLMSVTRSDYRKPPASEERIQQVSREAKKIIEFNKSDRPKQLYLRFGRLPEDGRSSHVITGRKEKGVSVYEAKPNLFGEYQVDLDAMKFPYVGAALQAEREGYLVEGREVGRGSDGEPLLQDAKIVRRLSPEETAVLYWGRVKAPIAPASPGPPPTSEPGAPAEPAPAPRPPAQPGATAPSADATVPELASVRAGFPLRNGLKINLALRTSGTKYVKPVPAKIVKIVDEHTVIIRREKQKGPEKVETVDISRIRELPQREALRRRGQYLAGLPREQRTLVEQDAREFDRILKESPYFFPVEAADEISVARSRRSAAITESIWRKSARKAALEILEPGQDVDMDNPRERARMLPALREWVTGPGREVQAAEQGERTVLDIKRRSAKPVLDVDLQHEDLVYRDGEWFRVDTEAGNVTRLLDGEALDLESFDTVDVQGVLSPGDPGYDLAMLEYEGQRRAERKAERPAPRNPVESELMENLDFLEAQERPEDQRDFLAWRAAVNEGRDLLESLQANASPTQADLEEARIRLEVIKQRADAIRNGLVRVRDETFQNVLFEEEQDLLQVGAARARSAAGTAATGAATGSPAWPGGPLGTPGTGPATRPESRLPIELPEMVQLARGLGAGRYPKVKQALRGLQGNALGFFRGQSLFGINTGEIELRADIFQLVTEAEKVRLRAEAEAYAKENATEERGEAQIAADRYEQLLSEAEEQARKNNPVLASKVLAHEIGHWIDFIPEGMLQGRGNILGHIASLKRFTRNMLPELPGSMDNILTNKDRQRLRRQAETRVGKRPPKSEQAARQEWSAQVSEQYADLVKEEAKARRLVTRQEIVDELRPLIAWWRGSGEQMEPYFEAPEEMYAEAFSAIMNNPAEVHARAPKFYDLFFNYVESRPEAKRRYDQLQEDITLGRVQDRRDREQVAAHIKADKAGETFERELERMSPAELRDAFLMAFDRRFAPIYSRINRNRGSERAPGVRKAVADYLYHHGLHRLYLERMNNDVLDILRGANVPRAEFNAYLENQHILHNRANIASMGGRNPRSAQQSLDAQRTRLGPEGWAAIERAEAARWEVRQREVLDLLDQAEVLGDDLMDVLRTRDKYSTVSAVNTDQDPVETLFQRTYGNDVSSRIYRQVGYLGEAKSPLLATARKDLSLITMAHRNRLKRELHGFLADIGDPLYREADYTWDENLKRRVPKIVDNRRVKTVVYLHKGGVRAFYASAGIHDMIEYSHPAYLEVPIRLLRPATNVLKGMWTSLNYGFWPFNYIRDTKGFVKRMPGVYSRLFGKNAYARYRTRAAAAARSISEGRPNADARLALKRNLLIERRDRVDSDQYEAFEKLMLAYQVDPREWGIKGGDRVRGLRRLWRRYTAVGERLERELKIAGMLHLDRTQPNIPEGEKQRMVHEFSGSPNFMERGMWNWMLDSIWPFYNPAKQGYRSAVHAWRERPAETFAKVLKYSVAPKLFIAALAAKGLRRVLGDDLSEELADMYDSISDYDRHNYDTIPIAWVDRQRGKVLYWRGVEEEEERIIGGALSKLLEGQIDPRDLINFGAGQLPGLNPLWRVGRAWSDYLAGRNPVDQTYPIIDDNRFAAGKGTEEMLKWTANQLGAGLVVRFSRDNFYDPEPTMVERILNAPVISNTLGRFLKVSNAGLRTKAREALEPIEREQARQRLQVRDVLIKTRSGQALDDADMAVLRQPGALEYFRRTAREMMLQRNLDPYTAELMQTRQSPEKARALLEAR